MGITLNEACRLFYQNVLVKVPIQYRHITTITDIGTAWIFGYGNPDTGEAPDESPYAVDRKGRIYVFALPNKDNFRLLDKGVNTEIPRSFT